MFDLPELSYLFELVKFASVQRGFCIFILFLSIWQWWRKPHVNFPPGPRGVPFLGAIPWLGKYPHISLCKMSKIYGSIISVRLGMKDNIVLNDYDSTKQAFVDKSSAFNNRAGIRLFKQVAGEYGIIMKNYDEDFKSQKLLALQAIKGTVGGETGRMKLVCKREVEHFMEFLKVQAGTPVDLTIPHYNFATNTIAMLVMGKRFNYEKSLNVSGVASEVYQLFSDPYESAIISLLVLFENLRFFPPFYGANQRFVKRQLKIIGMLRKIIEVHRENFDQSNIRDFVDALLYQQKQEPEKFSNDHLQFFVRDLFLAGAETTGNSLSWLLLYLLHYPGHHDAVVAEIDEVMGRHDDPPKVMGDLPLTSAFIQEVSRHCPIAPLGIQHETARDTTLGKFFIPAQTRVFTNIWAIHRDANIWKEPNKFNPLRHIKDGKFVFSKKIMPFGIGPRVCLGQELARMQVFTFLTKLLQKFEITSTFEKLPSLETGTNAFTFNPAKYTLIAKERNQKRID